METSKAPDTTSHNHISDKKSEKSKFAVPVLTEDQRADLYEAFDLFDSDGGGTINTTELKSLFRCFDIKLTDKETERLIIENDEDRSGEIDFDEFVTMMSQIIMK